MGEPPDHDCPLRQVVADQQRVIVELTEKLAAVTQQLQTLERRVLGPKSEKMPPPVEELRRTESPEDAEARRLGALERRRERAALREKLRSETVSHHVSDDD